MQENKYDDPQFFEQYSKMHRSQQGLEGAGEWYVLKEMLPDLAGKDVLDMGCGYGWHCRYAIEQGARSVIGVDISQRMLDKAKAINQLEGIEYTRKPLEELDYPAAQFDLVMSSLAFHYIASFESISRNVYKWLRPQGSFVFSVEHPVFTAAGPQDWAYGPGNEKLHWPVNDYFMEGKRAAIFLGEKVTKYHRTLTTYLNTLLQTGFTLRQVIEPQPSKEMLNAITGMKDELRRPMMLLIAAQK